MNMPGRGVWLLALLVGTATIVVSWPTVHDGLVFLDDGVYLDEAARHPSLSLATVTWAFTTSAPFYYQPLARLSHVIDRQVWRGNLAGHHATNLLLHGLNAGLVVLLSWLVLTAVPALSHHERLTASAVVGLVFGIHPLQVESVAWLAERKNVLCGFFSLACLIAYVRAVGGDEGHRRAWRWAVLVAYVGALLSKPMAVSLPLVMLILDRYPLGRSASAGWGRLLKEKTALFVLAGGLAALTVITQARVGALTDLARQSILARVLMAARAGFFYLWKLIWPAWLCPYYPLEGQVTFREPEFLVPAVLAVLLTALLIWQRHRRPALLAAGLAYAALLLPTAGLLQAGPQAAADRFMYLAMIPVLLLLGGVVIWAWRHLATPGRAALALLLVCECLFFGFRTRGQIVVWHDDETLWRAVLGYFPDSGFANCELAEALSRRGRFVEALEPAVTATRLTPGFGRARVTLGYVWLRLGKPALAVGELRQVAPADPSFNASRYHLACAYGRLGRLALAWETLQPLLAADAGLARQAASDPELGPLRDDPRYGPALQAGAARP